MSKPEFAKVFPSKKLINRILFQYDSNATSRTIIPIYKSIYNENKIPKKYRNDPNVLFLMNRVLAKVKKLSNYESIPLQSMRDFLLYNSALTGSNDAIALLSYEILSKKESPPDKKKEAEKLLKDLVMVGHGLSFKIVGDLYHSMGQVKECVNWYSKFLEQPELASELRGEVLEKIAEIEFKQDTKNIKIAEEKFLEVIKISKLQDCVKSYFYLAQIYIKYDPVKAKVLLEQCCSQGFKEAFKEIGYLEMNYFRNFIKAQEWFKIAMEIFDIECYFGYFDCSFELKEYNNCLNCLKSMENLLRVDKSYKDYIKLFVTHRAGKIQTVMKNMKKDTSITSSGDNGSPSFEEKRQNSNWDI